jgi:hypothetical protein
MMNANNNQNTTKSSNDQSSPMTGVNAASEAQNTPQTAQGSNSTAGQPFGAAPLLGDSECNL